jgi:hypothetical protein
MTTPDDLRRTAVELALSFSNGGKTAASEWVQVAIEQLDQAAAAIEHLRAKQFNDRLHQIIQQNGVVVFDYGFNEFLIYDDNYTLTTDAKPLGRGETLVEAVNSVRVWDE